MANTQTHQELTGCLELANDNNVNTKHSNEQNYDYQETRDYKANTNCLLLESESDNDSPDEDTSTKVKKDKTENVDVETYTDILNLYAKHEELLTLTCRISRYWLTVASIYWFFHCCRWYVWILYAESLGENHKGVLSFAVCAIFIFQGCSSLFWSWVADRYTYESVGVLIKIVTFLALLIEAISWNYSVLIMGTIIAALSHGIVALSKAFVTKYLPNKRAIKYLSIGFAFNALSNLS
eukprot:13094_1